MSNQLEKTASPKASETRLTEYAFDCTLVAALRVKATSQEEAESIIRSVLDAASCNAGAWPDGSPVLFEASIDGQPRLYEVDGESVQEIEAGNGLKGKAMSAIDAMLYFTFREGCDVGSPVVVDTATGEFDGEQAWEDMARLTEDDPAGPEGYYLQVGELRFEVARAVGSNLRFRALDLNGLQGVAAETSSSLDLKAQKPAKTPSVGT